MPEAVAHSQFSNGFGRIGQLLLEFAKWKRLEEIHISGLSNYLGKPIQKPRTGFEGRAAMEGRIQLLIPDNLEINLT